MKKFWVGFKSLDPLLICLTFLTDLPIISILVGDSDSILKYLFLTFWSEIPSTNSSSCFDKCCFLVNFWGDCEGVDSDSDFDLVGDKLLDLDLVYICELRLLPITALLGLIRIFLILDFVGDNDL